MVQKQSITKPRRWLSPSAALARFKPPQDSMITLPAAEQKWVVRYGFQIGDIGLLIGPNTVSEVLEQMPVYSLPNTRPWFVGLLNLRGNLVPVFDIKLLLDLEENATEKRRLLILDQGDKAVGLFIDSLPVTPDLGHKLTRLPPLPGPLRPFVEKAYVNAGTVWLEFEHRGFFQSLATYFA